MNWSGTLTVRNADDVAKLLQQLLGGQTYIVKGESGTHPKQRLRGKNPIIATSCLGAALVEVRGTNGNVRFDTGQTSGRDPRHISAHVTITDQGVTITQQRGGRKHVTRITVIA